MSDAINDQSWTIRLAGDTGLVLEFGNTVEREILDKVTRLDAAIHQAMESGQLIGVLETVPTFRSLAVVLDPRLTTPDTLADEIAQLPVIISSSNNSETRHWKIPVCYGDEYGPDLTEVAKACDLDEQAVIDLHRGETYFVYMLGFQPGFAFLGDTHEKLRLPRRTEPRLRVPAGSVAMANQLTGIYPWDSPGGWHIIGRCPTLLFSGKRHPPAIFRAGDRVSFDAVEQQQYQHLMEAREAGAINLDELRVDV